MGDDAYSTGVFIAVLIWLYHMVMIIVNANSQLSRNLRKVGMRLSWISGRPVAYDGPRSPWVVALKYALFGTFGLTGIFFSWFTVAWFAGAMVYTYSKQLGMPQAVREYRWKLRNLDMTSEQIEAESLAVGQAVAGAQAVKSV